jgi:hypothetical protein
VKWFTQALTRIQSWGASCHCCQEKWENNEIVECAEKGRLLPWAYQFGSARLGEFLATAEGWRIGEFGTDFTFLQSLLGCVRATHARGIQKITFIDEVPVLFSRLGLFPGIRERCIEQFEAAPRALHHRRTLELTDPDHESGLRAQLDAMPAYNVLSPDLSFAIQGIRTSSFNDKVAEGPHAAFKRIWQHSRASTFQWQAASARLSQNLADAETLPAACGADIQELWDNYKAVIRPKHTRCLKPVRCSRNIFEQRMYFCSSCFVADDEQAFHCGAPRCCCCFSIEIVICDIVLFT